MLSFQEVHVLACTAIHPGLTFLVSWSPFSECVFSRVQQFIEGRPSTFHGHLPACAYSRAYRDSPRADLPLAMFSFQYVRVLAYAAIRRGLTFPLLCFLPGSACPRVYSDSLRADLPRHVLLPVCACSPVYSDSPRTDLPRTMLSFQLVRVLAYTAIRQGLTFPVPCSPSSMCVFWRIQRFAQG